MDQQSQVELSLLLTLPLLACCTPLPYHLQALGCLLYLLCFGRLPFDGDAKLQILNGRYTMPSSRPEGLRGLIRDMLVVDQNKRLGINEVGSREGVGGGWMWGAGMCEPAPAVQEEVVVQEEVFKTQQPAAMCLACM